MKKLFSIILLVLFVLAGQALMCMMTSCQKDDVVIDEQKPEPEIPVIKYSEYETTDDYVDFGVGSFMIATKNLGAKRPEDHAMGQYFISYDDEKTNGHVDILMQVFTVDRAYVTKDELKKIKKENKMNMTCQNLQQFERGHKIPAVPADLQKRINEVVK